MYVTVPVVANTASATQSLPAGIQAVYVAQIASQAGGATSTSYTLYTVQTAAPTTGTEAQFTGTPSAPSGSFTLNAAPTAGTVFLVTYQPVGEIAANA